jgi:hypothetical protein
MCTVPDMWNVALSEDTAVLIAAHMATADLQVGCTSNYRRECISKCKHKIFVCEISDSPGVDYEL